MQLMALMLSHICIHACRRLRKANMRQQDHVYVYIYVYEHDQPYVDVYTHKHLHVHIYIDMYIYSYIVYIYIEAVCMHLPKRLFTCVDGYVNVCMYVCM